MAAESEIAVIGNRDDLDAQALLAGAAFEWRAAGAQLAGVLAEDDAGEGACSAGHLCDIASGKRYSIQLDAPPAGTACHLDADGVEGASTALLAQIPAADIVVLSKFGKLEAMQRGLWPAFAAAVAAGKPLLTTVSPKHADAWNVFAPGATWLAGDRASVDRWWQAIRPR
jgi:hypothetical protein